MIEEKLPDDINTEWIKLITSKENEHMKTFPALLKLLLEHKERIEYRQSGLRTSPSKPGGIYHVKESENVNDHDDRPKKSWCWLHPDRTDHPIWRYKAFEEKVPDERLELARSHKACFKCLQKGHFSRNWTRNFKCKEENCTKSHHQLLHDAQSSEMSFHN